MSIPFIPIGLLGTIVQAIKNAILTVILGVFGFLLDLMRSIFLVIEEFITGTPYPSADSGSAPLFVGGSDLATPWGSIYTAFESARIMASLIILISLTIVAFQNVIESYVDVNVSFKDVFISFFAVALWWQLGVMILAGSHGLAKLMLNIASSSGAGGGGIIGLLNTVEELANAAKDNNSLPIGTAIVMVLLLLVELILMIGISVIWAIRVVLIYVLMPTMPIMLSFRSLQVPGLKDLQQLGDIGLSLFVTLSFITFPGAILIGLADLVLTAFYERANEATGSSVFQSTGGDTTSSSFSANDKGSVISETAKSDSINVISSPVEGFNEALASAQVNSGPILIDSGGGPGPVTVSILIVIGMSIPVVAGVLPLLLAKQISGFNPPGQQQMEKISGKARDVGEEAARRGGSAAKSGAGRAGRAAGEVAAASGNRKEVLSQKSRGLADEATQNVKDNINEYSERASEIAPGSSVVEGYQETKEDLEDVDTQEEERVALGVEDREDMRELSENIDDDTNKDLNSMNAFRRGPELREAIENADDKEEAQEAAKLMTGAEQSENIDVEELEEDVDDVLMETEDGFEIDDEELDELEEDYGDEVQEMDQFVMDEEDYARKVKEIRERNINKQAENTAEQLANSAGYSEESATKITEEAAKEGDIDMDPNNGDYSEENYEEAMERKVKEALGEENYEKIKENTGKSAETIARDVNSTDVVDEQQLEQDIESELSNEFDQEAANLIGNNAVNSDGSIDDDELAKASMSLAQTEQRLNDEGEKLSQNYEGLGDLVEFDDEEDMRKEIMKEIRNNDENTFENDELAELARKSDQEGISASELEDKDVYDEIVKYNVGAGSEYSNELDNNVSRKDAGMVNNNISSDNQNKEQLREELDSLETDYDDLDVTSNY
jgi:hypothetical protein